MTASLHGDDGSFRLRNSNQSSGDCDPASARIEHVRAQHDAARVEAAVVPHWRGGQSHLLLRHILMRARAQFLSESVLFRLREFGAEYRLHPSRWECWFHDHGIKMT